MKRHDDTAEHIVTCEGLAFALASSVGKTGDLLEARGYLKAAIAKALEDEFNRGQRSVMAGDL